MCKGLSEHARMIGTHKQEVCFLQALFKFSMQTFKSSSNLNMVQTTTNKCTNQFFWGNGIIRLAMKWGFHLPKFTLKPKYSRWRISSMNEKMTWLPIWQHFLARGVLQRSSFLGDLEPSDKNQISGELQLEPIIMFPSCPPYQPLPQKTLSWVEILDRPVYFITVV